MKLLKEGTPIVFLIGDDVFRGKVMKNQGAHNATEVHCRHNTDDYRVSRDHVHDVTHLDEDGVTELVKKLTPKKKK